MLAIVVAQRDRTRARAAVRFKESIETPDES
jgi:hypothetical protein